MISIFRAFVFAATLVLGAFLSVEHLINHREFNFLQVSLLMFVVFGIEVFTNRRIQVRPLVPANIRNDALLHHLLLPILTYLSLVGFTYFNRQLEVRALFLAIGLIMFTLLFINVRAHYTQHTLISATTNYVYDLLKLLLFFLATNSFLNSTMAFGHWLFLFFPLFVIGIMALIAFRYESLERTSLRFILAATILIIFITAAGLAVGLTVMLTSLLSFLGFYLSVAILHHLIHHDLTKNLLLEYLAVFGIAVVLIFSLGTR